MKKRYIYVCERKTGCDRAGTETVRMLCARNITEDDSKGSDHAILESRRIGETVSRRQIIYGESEPAGTGTLQRIGIRKDLH